MKLSIIQFRLCMLIFLFIYPIGSFANTINQINTKNVTLPTLHNIKLDLSIKYDKHANHDPIRINGTVDFRTTAEAENWRGDGSSENPYMIDGLSIKKSGSLISIYHTDLVFRINNCFLTGLHPFSLGCGILLSNVSNGYITNNIIENIDGVGIFIEKSFNNIIIENSIQRNSREGIWIGESNSIDVFGNTIVENGLVGIDSYKSNCVNITLNQVRSNKWFGIRLRYSNNNLLFRISTFNNTDYGICVEGSNYNNVTWNVFIKNKLDGSSQAYDDGFSNSFAENFWNDWIGPDENEDGIVDSPYEIDGLSNNQDILPHISILKTFYMIKSFNSIHDKSYRKSNTNVVFGVFFLVIILILLGIVVKNKKSRKASQSTLLM